MAVHINVELLISLVENKPVLWDKTHESYNVKQMNFAAWNEICIIINDTFKTLTDKGKDEFRKRVIKKWNNARDNWVKCHKKIKKRETDSSAKDAQVYRYYDQMIFLSKIISPTENVNRINDEPTNSQANRETKEPTNKRKRKEVSDVDKQMINTISSIDTKDNSRIMSFFKGIAPTIDEFSDADIVEFQYEVIKSMRNISRRNQASHYLSINVPKCSCSYDNDDT